eukprot:gb/GECH01013184.1/.p1 GENE.gb/GECH01013184.1/~~gb/GECH01013184.1/.p1  ORF type:complete len:1092 (+),score=267.62 gb/GECH01013184.1/:1-3276(+)
MFSAISDDHDDYEEEDLVFNEYAIDDTLDSLSRLEKYHQSDISVQRLVLARELPDTLEESGFEECNKRMLPCLNYFVSDNEPAVRQAFAEVLPSIAAYFVQHGGESGYKELEKTFIPYTFELIIDKSIEVGQTATNSLVELAKHLKKDSVEKQLLNVVINLATEEKIEDYRIVAAQLFNELADVFGPKLCQQAVVKQITNLAKDNSFSVRKTVASNLGEICKNIGTENTVESVLPVFLELSSDEIWGVRKACAESLVYISEYSSPKVRSQDLVQVFQKFSEDVSRWVRMAAFQHLGQFIATFTDGDVDDNLLDTFKSMAFQNDGGGENDMAEYCAFNFPAVVITVKQDKWSQLKDAYLNLTKDAQWKVRRTLACSLHEIAKVLGTDLTEDSLLEPFGAFLSDIDEVKIGVVSHLASFLSMLSKDTQKEHLTKLAELPTTTQNWRIRKEIAGQLAPLSSTLPPEWLSEVYPKLVIPLLQDSVAQVRNVAIDAIGPVLANLRKGGEDTAQEFLDYILNLASDQSFQGRQMFVKISQSVAQSVDPEFFKDKFLPLLEKLSQENVSNVRLALAKTMRRICSIEHYADNDTASKLLEKLIEDSDSDVKYFASTSQTHAPLLSSPDSASNHSDNGEEYNVKTNNNNDNNDNINDQKNFNNQNSSQENNLSFDEQHTVPRYIRHRDEDITSSKWKNHKKHIFILSSAGKPVFSRYGDENMQSTLMGLLQAIVSFVQDSQDTVRCMYAGDHKFVFLLKGSLYFVAVASTTEPTRYLADQLDFIHSLILSLLTDAYEAAFQRKSSYDLRNLLGGTDACIHNLIHWMNTHLAYALHALPIVPLRSPIRTAVRSAFHRHLFSTALHTVLLSRWDIVAAGTAARRRPLDPADALLLINFVHSTPSMRTHETWTPVCLPKFHDKAFLYAYISFVADTDICLVIVCSSPEEFRRCSEAKERIVSDLKDKGAIREIQQASSARAYSVDQLKINGLRHFVYHNKNIAQYTCPEFGPPYADSQERKRLLRVYLQIRERQESSRAPQQLYYQLTAKECVVSVVMPDYELHAAFALSIGKTTATESCEKIRKWVRQQEDELFVTGKISWS